MPTVSTLPPWSLDPADQTSTVPALGDLFAAPALRWPDRKAVADDRVAYTFSDLEQQAQVLAGWLQSQGVAPGMRVVVLAQKCALMPLLAVAIWKSGAVYVPLDAAQPDARLDQLLARLAPGMVIALDERAPRTPYWLGRAALDAILAGPFLASPTIAHSAADTAYIIFTSGSTSEPKGVEITVGNLVAYFRNHNEVLRFSPIARVLSLAPFHFDVSIEDTLLPLSLGAFVYQFRSMPAGAIMRAALAREEITHLIAVSTLLTLITEDGSHITPHKLPHLQMVMTGAEVCDPGIINLWKARLPALRIINAYGPTEATIVCMSHEITQVEATRTLAFPIGKPLRNVAIRIMGETGEIRAAGQTGELWVGGEQVMRGYFDQPEENLRVLVQVDGVPYYRTGDVCCYDAQGDVQFVGRNDDEVKINGRRIHLGEIRQRALSFPGVERAAVCVVRRHQRDCIGLVVMAAQLGVLPALEAYFKEHLPDYMVPGIVAWSPTLAVSATGKTDEKLLCARLKDAVKLSGSNYFALSNVGIFEPFKEPDYA
jgi:amino acid adenylation domain-containing protein